MSAQTVAAPGYNVHILDENKKPVAPGTIDNVVVKLPLPPGCLMTLWNNDDGYIKSYLKAYPGYYLTSDAGYIDSDSYIYIMSRIDNIINVAGHRLSTGGMEEVLASHADVAECAVIGVADQLKGEVPLGLFVINSNTVRDDKIIAKELVQLVRQHIGPVAAFKHATVVPRLHKTRSGKILRGTVKRIADGSPYTTPATIDDPPSLDEIAEALRRLGYPKKRGPT